MAPVSRQTSRTCVEEELSTTSTGRSPRPASGTAARASAAAALGTRTRRRRRPAPGSAVARWPGRSASRYASHAGTSRRTGRPRPPSRIRPPDGSPWSRSRPASSGSPRTSSRAHPQDLGVPGRDEQPRLADDVGQSAAVARHDRDAGGHGLDRDPPELLDPRRRRQGGDRQHVEAAVEVGELVVVESAQERHPIGQVGLRGPPTKRSGRGTVTGEGELDLGHTGNRVEQDVDTLVVGEPPGVAHDGGAPRGGRVGRALQRGDVDAERDEVGSAREPTPFDQRPGGGVAHADRPGATEGPPLERPERRGQALLEVLGGVQRIRGSLPPQGPQREDLRGGEGERLLVDVDEVPGLSEGPPQRARVVDEQSGMAIPRSARPRPARRPGARAGRGHRPRPIPERSAGARRPHDAGVRARAHARRRRRRCGRSAARARGSSFTGSSVVGSDLIGAAKRRPVTRRGRSCGLSVRRQYPHRD